MIVFFKNVELRLGINCYIFIYKGEEYGILKGKYVDL